MNESFKTIVSLLPLNGVWFLFWSKALMHYFRANKDLLISAPSILVCFYNWSAWSAARSLPAKSMKVILPCGLFFFFKLIWRIAWERDESLLVPFCEVTLMLVPYSITCIRFYALWILVYERPTMLTLFLASYLD